MCFYVSIVFLLVNTFVQGQEFFLNPQRKPHIDIKATGHSMLYDALKSLKTAVVTERRFTKFSKVLKL
jgi:hypothetical protein